MSSPLETSSDHLTFKEISGKVTVKNPREKVDNNKRGESGNDSRFTKHDFKNLVKHH